MADGFEYFGRTPSGVEMTLTLTLTPEKSAAEIAAYLKSLDLALKGAGFTRSDRLDKPAPNYGGGGRPGAPRPEAPPPEDLEVPEHCAVPMIYKPPKEASGDRKAVAARWECRKGRDCAAPEERRGNRYPATNWHLTKKAAPPAGNAPPRPTEGREPAQAPKPDQAATNGSTGGWTGFWRASRELGFTSDQVLLIAGELAGLPGKANISGFTGAQQEHLLEELRSRHARGETR